MIFLLSVLGGAAVLEIRKFVGKGKTKHAVRVIEAREQDLKKLLQEVQSELKEEKEVRVREEQRAEDLSKSNTELEQENQDLLHRADALLETQTILEEAAEMLRNENGELSEQVEQLKLENEEHAEELEKLRVEVAEAFEAFSDGTLSGADFLEHLQDLGVEIHCTEDNLRALPSAQDGSMSARLREQNLATNSNFSRQLRLLSDSPERVARLLAASAFRDALHPSLSDPSRPLLPLKTPPKDHQAAERSLFGSRAALSIGSWPLEVTNKENEPVVHKLVSPEVAAASSAAAAAATQQQKSAPQAPDQDQEIKANRALQFKKDPKKSSNGPQKLLGLNLQLPAAGKRVMTPQAAMASFSFDDDAGFGSSKDLSL